MKNRLFITVVILFMWMIKASAQDVGINILMQPASIPKGGTGVIRVDISNNDGGNTKLPQGKIRPLISVPSTVNITGVTDLPAGWAICSQDLTNIRVSNGTDGNLAPGDEYTFYINVTGVTIDLDGSSITATLAFGAGPSSPCTNGAQTVGNVTGNDNSTTSVAVGPPLPVAFGAVQALFKGNDLVVNWETASENNNKEFVIEASKDGENYKEIGRVASQAAEGSSAVALKYSFTRPWQDVAGMLGFPIGIAVLVMSVALMAFVSKKRRMLLIPFMVLSIATIAYSCKKEAKEAPRATTEKANVFVRVGQVDKSAVVSYSSAAKVVNQ